MRRKAKLSVVVLGLAVVLTGTQGCYREVINAKGIGSDAHYPRRAESSETNIDKAIDDVVRKIDE